MEKSQTSVMEMMTIEDLTVCSNLSGSGVTFLTTYSASHLYISVIICLSDNGYFI